MVFHTININIATIVTVIMVVRGHYHASMLLWTFCLITE
ncbi:hypothetical protein YPPY13_1494 [Yersinia pestis PY-13]|nr:hypothetical protein YPPY01_1404 [Yersinia pestis PY-01]EIR49120.1 hypothetical protein YPPY13_1494 [Yersinia pestis PY-13]EIS31431.1 hypothetical protein YPPY55_1468 [Yersinia pestis PY-55]KNC56642.1 hypothetical protein M485_1834 [Yersinia pestis 14735]